MQNAQRDVAIQIAADQNPKTVNIVDLRKAVALFFHLAVDGKDGFLARGDARLEACCGKGLFNFFLYVIYQRAAALVGILQRLLHNGVAPGMQVFEGKVFQLAVAVIQPQPIGQRRVNFQRLGRDAGLRLTLHVRHGAHIVQAVCQLHQNDAHIVGHGQQHLAKRLGLIFLPTAEAHFVELGQAIHQLGDLGAELLGKV